MGNKSNNPDATRVKELKKVSDPGVGTRGEIVRHTKVHSGKTDPANDEPYNENMNRDYQSGVASSGTSQPAHKSNEADANTKSHTVKGARVPEEVREIDRDKNKGAALKAGMKQRTGTYDGAEDSNPKKQKSSFKE